MNWPNAINYIMLFGLVVMGILDKDYPKAIFFYLVLTNLERKL